MPKIEKLPSGNYRVRVYDAATGKRKSITASSRSELKLLLADFVMHSDKKRCDLSVSEAIDGYISNRSAVASPSTIRGYRQMQRNYYEYIRNFSVDTITAEDIQREINRWAVDHSPKTVRNVLGLLISSIRAVRPDKSFSLTLPQKEVHQYHLPSEDDIKELLRDKRQYMRIAIMLASVGTLRRGEIAALCYEDISGNVIHVHRDMVRNEHNEWVIKDIPKNSASDRFVELPPELIAEIGTGEGRIIPVVPDTITKQYDIKRDKLGLKCRFHDLRHYAASIMHALGVPDQYIMKRGGWSSDVTLKSVYRNVIDEKEKEFSDLTNEYLKKFF